MICQLCDGMVDETIKVTILVGCPACAWKTTAFPCQVCGRLHSSDGDLIYNIVAKGVFLEDGIETRITKEEEYSHSQSRKDAYLSTKTLLL